MNFNKIIPAITVTLMLGALSPIAHAAKPVELFGVSIKDATRDNFRQAVKNGGLKATREDNDYWYDNYAVSGVIPGASEFTVGYTMKQGKFAHAMYTFPSFIDVGQVKQVIDLVSKTYGKPNRVEGHYAAGEVKATWNLDGKTQLVVSRGWPVTTTYLQYINKAEKKLMEQEIKAHQSALKDKEQQKIQGKI